MNDSNYCTYSNYTIYKKNTDQEDTRYVDNLSFNSLVKKLFAGCSRNPFSHTLTTPTTSAARGCIGGQSSNRESMAASCRGENPSGVALVSKAMRTRWSCVTEEERGSLDRPRVDTKPGQGNRKQ